MVEFEDGSVTRINPKNQTQQESLLKRLLTPDEENDCFKGVKMVRISSILGYFYSLRLE